MDQAEKDLKMFRDFVLELQEKAVLVSAIISLGRRDIAQDSKDKRKKEKQKALTKFNEEAVKQELSEFSDVIGHTHKQNDSKLKDLAGRVKERNKKLLILIEMYFASPYPGAKYAPKDKLRKQFIEWLADIFGISKSDLKELMSAYKGTLNVHMGRRWKIGIGIATGLALGAIGGWALAPAIGGALGSAAGLGGAAATAHGLALLGGGALAAGGAGMAGGIALVTVMGSSIGGLLALGSTALLTQAGAANVKVDTMKLQMVLAKIIIGDQKDTAKAQEIMKRQEQEIRRLKKKLVELEKDAEHNKEKIKSLKKIIKTLERAVNWTNKRAS